MKDTGVSPRRLIDSKWHPAEVVKVTTQQLVDDDAFAPDAFCKFPEIHGPVASDYVVVALAGVKRCFVFPHGRYSPGDVDFFPMQIEPGEFNEIISDPTRLNNVIKVADEFDKTVVEEAARRILEEADKSNKTID